MFSSVYFYDGLTYYGNRTFVQCAEEQMRYAECSFLKICVNENIFANSISFLSPFPLDFFLVAPSDDEMLELLLNENQTCNVIITEQSHVLKIRSMDAVETRNFVAANDLVTKEPVAAVTRKNDAEFTDIVNYVVQAIIYGEEKGIMKDLELCRPYTSLTGSAADLNFLYAVYCMGNYGQIVFDGQ